MPYVRRLTLNRLEIIYKRQDNPSWGPDYTPSILATRGEAPSISNAITVQSNKFGREIHLLSMPEQSAFLVAAYNPCVVGLQEQRMLSPEPRQHPMSNFPGVVASSLPPLKGIIDAADRLGYLRRLPRLTVPASHPTCEPIPVVFPYVGDFLLAVTDKKERMHCINWSIKADEAGFKRPISNVRRSRSTAALKEEVLARHELERTYYADAGIRTILVATSTLDHQVTNNLRFLYAFVQRPLNLTMDRQEELEARFQSCIEAEIPITALLPPLMGAGKYTLPEIQTCLFQAIWARRLRVDLFRPILIDRPLYPEVRDVLSVYSNLYSWDAI